MQVSEDKRTQSLRRKVRLENEILGDKIILKLISQKQNSGLQILFVCLRTGTIGGLF